PILAGSTRMNSSLKEVFRDLMELAEQGKFAKKAIIATEIGRKKASLGKLIRSDQSKEEIDPMSREYNRSHSFVRKLRRQVPARIFEVELLTVLIHELSFCISCDNPGIVL